MALLPPTYIRTCIITICVSVYLHAERHAWDMPCLFWMESAVYGNAGQGGSKGGEGCILGGGCMHEGAGLAGSWDGKALTGFFACILPKRPNTINFYGWLDPNYYGFCSIWIYLSVLLLFFVQNKSNWAEGHDEQ
jgi:hypothetical protein